MTLNAIPGEITGGTPIYLSCSPEDLIAVEIQAWTQGGDRAARDIHAKLKSIETVRQAAEKACDEALQIYIPMDVDRFHDVFTRAWSAGYCIRAGLILSEKPRVPEGEIH